MTKLETESNPSTGLMEEIIQKPMGKNHLAKPTKDEGELKVELNTDHIAVIKKQYKEVKKYMRSPIYQIRVMDGKEKIVNELLDKYYQEEL